MTNFSNWMGTLHQRFQQGDANPFGDVPLCQLPLPGSHDSGTYGTFTIRDSDARTQNMTLAQQLALGIRYFDLRPMVDDGSFYIAHWAKSDVLLASWPGGVPTDAQMDADRTSLLGVLRDFLKQHPREVVILKFQSFDAATSQKFNGDDHIHFRKLLAAYLPLIAPMPVVDVTLNRIYQGTGRVLVFHDYKDDAPPSDPSWAPIWPYQVSPGQPANGRFLDLVDPFWEDDLGASGADDGDDDYRDRWQPYHRQNLLDMQARGQARFMVTQAHMQPAGRNKSQEDSAKRNNPKNVEWFCAWMKAGVPGGGALRPNILTMDFIENSSLCAEIVHYFESMAPNRFDYPYAALDHHPMYVRGSPETGLFATNLSAVGNLLAPAGFLVHHTPAPGSTAIVALDNGSGQQFKYAVANAPRPQGWRKLGTAFHAFATPAPGTVPVYEESRVVFRYRRYHYSTRDASAASKAGWRQDRVAFHAYPEALRPVYVHENRTNPGYYRLSTSLKPADGWLHRGAAFFARTAASTDTTTIHQETDGKGLRYQYVTRDEGKQGWQTDGVAFHGSATPQLGMVAVYVETPIAAPHTRYNYSTRTPAEAAHNGWQQLHVAFYAYPYPLPGA